MSVVEIRAWRVPVIHMWPTQPRQAAVTPAEPAPVAPVVVHLHLHVTPAELAAMNAGALPPSVVAGQVAEIIRYQEWPEQPA